MDRPKLRINSLHSRFVIYKACKFRKSSRNFFIRGGTDESIPHHLCLYTIQILTIFTIAVRKRKEINSENLQGGCYFHGASTLICRVSIRIQLVLLCNSDNFSRLKSKHLSTHLQVNSILNLIQEQTLLSTFVTLYWYHGYVPTV